MLTKTRVNRSESKETVGATVLETDGESVLISYDEGGEGWWPISSLETMQPHGANAPEATRFPAPLTPTKDGPVDLPPTDLPQDEAADLGPLP